MLVDFYRDPVDLEAVCSDLSNDGVVVIDTSRSNLREIQDAIALKMPDATILPGSTEDAEGQWHLYLLNNDLEPLDTATTWARVARAVAAWQAAGSPFPYSARA